MQEKIRTCFILMITFIIAMLCLVNLKRFVTVYEQKKVEGIKEANDYAEIENAFRENIACKNILINTYGFYQKAINHTIVGNFEYVADEYGILHMINDTDSDDIEGFTKELKELKSYVDKMGLPFMYVQAPNREVVNGDNAAIKEFNIDDFIETKIVEKLQKEDIPVLDLRTRLSVSERTFELTDLFLHTDLHMKTDAEIWMAAQLADYLNAQFDIEVNNPEYLSDMSYFDKKTYKMVGNYARTYGEFFVGSDDFDIYHPKFGTSFQYYIPGRDDSNRNGTFEEIVLNGYENNEYNQYTYWVTNYMHFMEPYYTYINNSQPSVKLLIMTDSIAYRAISQLLLTTQKITILDPRFFGDVDYVKVALQDDYDAVIVWQGCYLLNAPFLIK